MAVNPIRWWRRRKPSVEEEFLRGLMLMAVVHELVRPPRPKRGKDDA